MNSKISKMDQGIRLAAGAALILGVLTNPFSPAWMALIGAYAVLTAIFRWEPVYAIAALTKRETKAQQVVISRRRLALES